MKVFGRLLAAMAAVSLVTCMAPALAHAATDAPADLKVATTLTARQNASTYQAAPKTNSNKSKSYANQTKAKNLANADKNATLYTQRKITKSALTKAKAKRVFAPVLKSLRAKHYCVYYKYANIIGDRTVELIAYAYPRNEGVIKHNYIYTIKSGKPKLVVNDAFYSDVQWNTLTYRKSTRSLVYYFSGWNGSAYRYLKYSGGKYKDVAYKRYSRWSGKWSYGVSKGVDSISKAAFDKKTKRLTAGEGVEIDISTAKMARIKNEANWNKP